MVQVRCEPVIRFRTRTYTLDLDAGNNLKWQQPRWRGRVGLEQTITYFKQFDIFENEQGNIMNKTEFVDAVAAKGEMTKSEAADAVEAVLESVTDALKAGEQITLVGFGTFLVRDRKARQGRNPRTGDVIEIAASKVPSFKAGKALKDSVN